MPSNCPDCGKPLSIVAGAEFRQSCRWSSKPYGWLGRWEEPWVRATLVRAAYGYVVLGTTLFSLGIIMQAMSGISAEDQARDIGRNIIAMVIIALMTVVKVGLALGVRSFAMCVVLLAIAALSGLVSISMQGLFIAFGLRTIDEDVLFRVLSSLGFLERGLGLVEGVAFGGCAAYLVLKTRALPAAVGVPLFLAAILHGPSEAFIAPVLMRVTGTMDPGFGGVGAVLWFGYLLAQVAVHGFAWVWLARFVRERALPSST